MAYYEPGNYDCIIQDQGFSESKEKKTPCFWLRFLPVKRDDQELADNAYEREVRLWLTDKTVERTIDQLRELGWQGSRWAELEPGGGHSFDGVNVRLRCTHSQDGDKLYENWEFPAPQSQQSENTSGIARKLDALFGKAMQKKNGKPASSQPSKPAPQPVGAAAEADDDIPF